MNKKLVGNNKKKLRIAKNFDFMIEIQKKKKITNA